MKLKLAIIAAIGLSLSACDKDNKNTASTPVPDPTPDLTKGCGDFDADKISAYKYLLPIEQANPAKPGGETTISRKTDVDAFSEAADNLDAVGLTNFESGDRVFQRLWEEAPKTLNGLQHRDGLGPLFNLASCQGCHIKDARGHVPNTSGIFANAASMLIRVSIPYDDVRATTAQRLAKDDCAAPVIPHPIYGGQFQDQSISSFANSSGEGDINITWTLTEFTYPDNTSTELRKPTFELVNLSFGELGEHELSPRISPQMIGLGLLEAIPAEAILQQQDINDTNNDGISGKANVNNGELGRFGWKAGNVSLRAQSLGAFAGDIGVTSADATNTDCTQLEQDTAGIDCKTIENSGAETGSNNGGFELRPEDADELTFYAQHLAVPARGDVTNIDVIAGEILFKQVGCDSCHTPYFQTENHDSAALSNQHIFPYTDLLLHDMGAELADERPEFLATGNEWRTAPLWGIGLTGQIVGASNAQFLHDGRARNIEEAILWHGGEAETSKTKFSELTQAERLQLIQFIQDL